MPHDKTNKMTVHPAKTQISPGIRQVWSESSLCAQWVAKDPSFLHWDSEDSDQTGDAVYISFLKLEALSSNMRIYAWTCEIQKYKIPHYTFQIRS